MSNAFDEKMLFSCAIAGDISKSSTDRLGHDWWSMYVDTAKTVGNYWTQANLDRRAVAVGSMLETHYWDFMSDVPGFKEFLLLHSSIYPQMFVDIKAPQRALIFPPARYGDLVLLLQSKGTELYFLNNDLLREFESSLLNHPDYNFSSDYNVIDLDEFEAITDLTFDFVVYDIADIRINNSLFTWTLDRLATGGIGYFANCNEMTRMYSDNYHLLPIYDLFELLEERADVSYYHIPWAAGIQVITKH